VRKREERLEGRVIKHVGTTGKDRKRKITGILTLCRNETEKQTPLMFCCTEQNIVLGCLTSNRTYIPYPSVASGPCPAAWHMNEGGAKGQGCMKHVNRP